MGPIFDGSPLFDLANYEKKPLLFHEFVHKGLTNFGCSELKLYTLNYHSKGYFLIKNINGIKMSNQIFKH